MKEERSTIPLAGGETVSSVLTIPDEYGAGQGTGIILAHGAANDLNHPLLTFVAHGLAEAGYLVLRFNFLYREKGRKTPDRQEVLVDTWQSVHRFLSDHPGHSPNAVVVGGKSLGGRVASQMVAEGLLPADGLIFLGYPLHPPGKKEKLRDSHLYRINIPMLTLTMDLVVQTRCQKKAPTDPASYSQWGQKCYAAVFNSNGISIR